VRIASLIIGLAAAWFLTDVQPLWAEPAPPASGKVVLPPSQDLDDPTAPFVPTRPRSEQQQNHLEAMSLFAAGRMCEQHEDFAGALKFYQRALRFDPEALPVLRQIVPLAFNLNRTAEAVRYALKVVELDPSDPLMLRQLGLQLTDQGDLSAATKLYERARAQQVNKKSAGYILLTFDAGRLYHQVKMDTEAADAFAEVMAAMEHPKDFSLDQAMQKALAGEDGKNYELFAKVFTAADRKDDAIRAWEKVEEKLASKKSLQAYCQAQIDWIRKLPPQALAKLQIYFDEHETKQGRAPYELLAELLKAQDKSGELVERLEKILAGDEQNVQLRYYLADQYSQAKKFDKAEKLYAALVEKSPTGESYRGLVEAYRETKQYKPLLKTLAKIVEKSDDLDPLGEELEALESDPALVTALVAAAREENKAQEKGLDRDTSLAVALLALEAKQFAEAGEFYEIALQQSKPDQMAQLFLSWGLGLLLAERYDDAAQIFDRGIKKQVLPSGNPAFHYYLSGALEMAGKTDEAVKVAKQGAALGAGSARIESRIGWVLYHAKRYDDAFEKYKALVERYQGEYKSDETRKVVRETRLILSNICVQQNKIPEAEEWLEQVLDEFPADFSAMNDLGYLWADQGKNLERALKMIQEAVNFDPKNKAFRDSLGWCLYRLGRFQEAVPELKLAIEDDPADTDGVIYDHLADGYLAAGKTTEARDTWQLSIQAFEKKGETAKAQKVREKLQTLLDREKEKTAKTDGAKKDGEKK
jgi:tetratricopeptide (TPR) repeat protein